ncbi:hypothetical protein VS_2626 [Vibrio atlanticus]|uniref:Uncharacterized protein n=1 Tax=Vibrio atlanticus (strain LGP32) TaxID=575788 RepID=B7VK86_VIBA3|nr:hypothetical protein VS_2626 [Vibrio atlanticus]
MIGITIFITSHCETIMANNFRKVGTFGIWLSHNSALVDGGVNTTFRIISTHICEGKGYNNRSTRSNERAANRSSVD